MKFLDKEIKQLNLEITNRCALACPGCARTRTIEYFKEQKRSFEIGDLSLDQIKEFEPLFLQLDHLTLSGSFGDALYHPQFKEILTYIVSLGINHTIETNGSGKSSDFWRQISEIVSPEHTYWIFSIDGLEDTNHLYRQNSKWHSVFKGIETLAPKCKVIWKYIVFAHNEHQIESAKELAQKLGVYDFSLRGAGHLTEDSPFYPATRKFVGFKRENKARVKEVLKRHARHQLNEPVDQLVKIFPSCLESHIDVFISSTHRFYPCCGTEYESEGPANDPKSWFTKNRENFDLKSGLASQLSSTHWNELRKSWASVETASIECIKRCGVHRDYWKDFEQKKRGAKDLELTFL